LLATSVGNTLPSEIQTRSPVVKGVLAHSFDKEAAEPPKRRHPHSAVVVTNLQTGEKTAVVYKFDLRR